MLDDKELAHAPQASCSTSVPPVSGIRFNLNGDKTMTEQTANQTPEWRMTR